MNKYYIMLNHIQQYDFFNIKFFNIKFYIKKKIK